MSHLRIVDPAEANGPLAEVYAKLATRTVKPVYKPAHGGLAGIIRAHSLDPALMTRVFATSGSVNGLGPLTWPHRELIASVTSRLNQCFY
jgi:hypothetical protein